MFDFPETRIHPLTEKVFDEIIEVAGGHRAYSSHDDRAERNADYVLGDAVLELKILDDDSLAKAVNLGVK